MALSILGIFLFFKFKEKYPSPDLTMNEIMKTYAICGIDISRYQTHIDWEKVSLQLDFVFIRASSGKQYKDPLFEEHYANANDFGIPASAYHYFVFNVNGTEQAENFLETIGDNSFELPLVIDVEEHPKYGRSTFNYQSTIKNLSDFIYTVEKKSGKEILIYTNKECYNKYIKHHFPEHKIWICSFKDENILPPQWVFWQKTHTGKIDGIKGDVDIDVFNGNPDAWLTYIGEVN